MTTGWTAVGLAVGAVGAVTVGSVLRIYDRPGVAPFSLFISLLGGMAVMIALQRADLVLTGSNPTVEALLIVGYVFASPLWIAFVFEYTGRGPTMTWRYWVGLATLAVLTIASTALTWGQETGRLSLGILGRISYLTTFVLQLAVFSLGLLGVVLIVRSALQYDDLPSRFAAVFIIGGLGITFLPVTLTLGQGLGREPTLVYSFLQLLLIISLFGATEFLCGLFESGTAAGHLARESLLETVTSPVVVADRENRLLDLNQSAQETFGVGGTRLRRRTLNEIAGLTAASDLSSPLTIQTQLGRRKFDVSRSTIDDGDTVIGYAYRFRDVTDRKTREQRLQVLNRVTRHNLRNDLDAIRGFAEAVRDDNLNKAEAERYFDRIGTLARGLVDLSVAVERSNRLLFDPMVTRDQCNLESLAKSVVDDADSDTVTVDSPSETVEILTDSAVARLILEELVENALEHSNREDPTVTVIIRRTSEGGELEVCDDGPGIPERERQILLTGKESAAMHGTGIGLWLVYWGVTRLGGQLSFADRQPQGSVVTVSLPDHGSAKEANTTF